MFTIFALLILGVAAGYLFRKNNVVSKLTGKLLIWSIYLLLFLLGIAVGSNQTIISNFAQIGVTALVLSLAGTFSSVLLAAVIYRFFWVRK